ncbi:MAG: SDR family oxidoreductase [Spirochaetes bacterium]|nr:SDR family oxidoreductase [Spirochaetota bacterium]
MKMKGKALDGKVAVVTGGASGIGEAVGKIFALNSCRVILIDKNRDRLERVVEEIAKEGGNCKGIYADVSVESQVRKFFQDVIKVYGRVDILVNSAGRDSLSPPITEVTFEEWEKTIDSNLKAVFLCCREAFIIMEKQGGGKIINMGSTSARLASGPGHSPYRASKHGMMGLSKNLLIEGMDKNINVTVINPSHVKTPMTEIIDKGLYDENIPAYLEGWLDEKEIREGIYKSCIGVENVAEIVLFVATRDSSVTIPQIAIYPTHKIHRYGMEV